MMRRVILYGRFLPEVQRRLVTQYGVEIVLSADRLQSWMLPAFRDGEYNLAVLDDSAPRAAELARAIEHRHVPVVTVHLPDSVENILAAILAATHWTPGNTTVFIVVISIKGGVGKSTMAGALAELLSMERKKRVLLVDDNPAQSNAARIFVDVLNPMRVEAIGHATETVNAHITRVHDGLDLLVPEDYASSGGVTYADARIFWQAIATGLGYDIVIVDTTPSLATPSAPEEWAHVNLASALLVSRDVPEIPSVFVVPFTPDPWGWDAVEKTRSLLDRHARLDDMVPVVVATDAQHVLENVPRWLREEDWRKRLHIVPYNGRVRASPRALRTKGLFHDPLKPYRPVTDYVLGLLEKMSDPR